MSTPGSPRLPRPRLATRRSYARLVSKTIAGIAGSGPPTMEDLWEISKVMIDYRKSFIDRYLESTFGFHVASGPFRGMALIEEALGSLIGPKILGTYESELDPVVASLAARESLVNLGCAEGYFAVGCLLAHGHLRTTAFDTDPAAQRRCLDMARLNGVADRLTVGARCDPDALVSLARPGTLILMDIEGAEAELLGAIDPAALAAADVVVETHGLGPGREDASTLDFLLGYFGRTHDVAVIDQAHRDPRPFPELMALGQLDRFLAQWEGRGPHGWLWARPRR